MLPSSLSSSQRRKLHALGISTSEEILGLFNAVPELATDYLGDALPADPFAQVGWAPLDFLNWFDEIAKHFNARLDAPSWLRMPYAAYDTKSLPAEVNLQKICGPIQNQAKRGTCVAFATVSALEAAHNKGKTNLSEQMQYWICKQVDGMPSQEGSWVSTAFEKGIPQYGFCEETLWPYNPEFTGDPGQGPAPKEAVKAARKNKAKRINRIEANSVDALKAALNAGDVIAMSVPVFASWARNPETARTGKIGMPIPGEDVIGGHAMAFVGYKNDANAPGGGYFIVRNSWGTAWANESPVGAGYALMPYAYMTQFGKEAYTVKL